MYGSAILSRRGSVGYRGFRARAVRADRAVLSETGNGRPPVGVERMLRIYLLQHGFDLSDLASNTRSTIRRRWRVANALTEGGAMLCGR
jgi:hypothetical protein